MKRSIGLRIAVSFILIMGLALGAIGIVNKLFLVRYYYVAKEDKLIDSWEQVNADESVVNTDDFYNFCSVNSLTFAFTNSTLGNIVSNSADGEGMAGRLLGNMLSMENDNTNVIKDEDQYQVSQIRDQFMQLDFLQLWGQTDNGNYFIVRCPVDSMGAAASISFRFLMYVGAVVTAISCLVIYLISRRIVKPMKELAVLSQRMSELDFNAKYMSGGEDEVGVLGQSFNVMSDKLHTAITDLQTANVQLQKDIDEKIQIDDMRKEFLSNVSHELKTPIALIQGYAEGLSDMVIDDPESMNYYCEVIVDEANKMNHLVRQLLNLNQLEFGKDQLYLENFDLCELIHGVINKSSLLIQKKEANVVFEPTAPIWVEGDVFKIEEVVTNYMTNALNHLEHGNDVTIRCSAENGIVKTRVCNNGNPIPEDELDKIWIKFYKVDKARTRAYGGSGIGLSIVKAIMDAHKQTCYAENCEDGVAFYFTLPQAAGPAEA